MKTQPPEAPAAELQFISSEVLLIFETWALKPVHVIAIEVHPYPFAVFLKFIQSAGVLVKGSQRPIL